MRWKIMSTYLRREISMPLLNHSSWCLLKNINIFVSVMVGESSSMVIVQCSVQQTFLWVFYFGNSWKMSTFSSWFERHLIWRNDRIHCHILQYYLLYDWFHNKKYSVIFWKTKCPFLWSPTTIGRGTCRFRFRACPQVHGVAHPSLLMVEFLPATRPS